MSFLCFLNKDSLPKFWTQSPIAHSFSFHALKNRGNSPNRPTSHVFPVPKNSPRARQNWNALGQRLKKYDKALT